MMYHRTYHNSVRAYLLFSDTVTLTVSTTANAALVMATLNAMEYLRVKIPVIISCDAVEYVIHHIRDNYYTPPALRRPNVGTPETMLQHRMRELCISAAQINRIELIRVLYKHGYYLYSPHSDTAFRSADSELASIIMHGVIEQDNRNWTDFHRSYGPPNNFIQRITLKGFDKCVSVIVNESVNPEFHLRLLSHSVAVARLDYITQVLDRGLVTVNDNKQHFYRAVKRVQIPIVTEFIRRGVTYNCEEVIRAHLYEWTSRRGCVDSPDKIALRRLLRDNAAKISDYFGRTSLIGR